MKQLVVTHPVVSFIRRRDYLFVKNLGQGACGETVLLRDDVIERHFVCKKYAPLAETHREELFANFMREIRLLHEIHHPNVVRVFNYYLYPDKLSGYILMEYVEGTDIEDHISANPDAIAEVLRQVIDGFAYLESISILHRDIRPQNILVTADGRVKIIDLGFGKQVQQQDDFDKSISLNWWCEPPSEFATQTYDFTTEVYFVGKLFERFLQDQRVEDFKYAGLLGRMCQKNPHNRIQSFADVQTQLATKLSEEVHFNGIERKAYKEFADEVVAHITKIESAVKYHADLERVRQRLDEIYRSCMLEEELPDCAPVLRCLLDGTYYYKKAGFSTRALRDFLQLLNYAHPEKQRIALANLHTRLDAVQRYTTPKADDDIPF
jgi:tRNA A-37 threonylcarbamoyl transferase component Bud32